MGRPSKLSRKLKERLFEALLAGNHLESACAYAGISYSTMAEWIRRGEGRHHARPSSNEFAQFAYEVRAVIAEAEAQMVNRVSLAASSDWRAAAWMLERRHPTRWANSHRVQIEVDKELDKVLDRLENALSPEAFDRVLDILSDGDQGEAEAGGAPEEF